MKKTKILAGFLLASSLHACSWFGDPNPSLPPETQNGAETFGCLVNGKVFVAGSNLGKNYDGSLVIGGTDKNELSVIFGIDNVTKIGIYKYTRKANLLYSILRGCYYGNQTIPLSGQVEITKFERGEDKANNLRWLIVSGRFEGVITSGSPNCKDTLRITQGRFDVKFE